MSGNSIIAVGDMTQQELQKVKDKNIDSAIANIFNLTPDQTKEAKTVANLYQIKHGLTAAIPIMCKGQLCPYAEVCSIDPMQRTPGTRCLHEIGVMVARFESLCTELEVTDNDAVDAGLVKDVVDIEMMMLRVDKRFAISGDILADIFEAVDQFGKEHFSKGVDPLLTFKLQLYEKKMKLLEKLNSTRKDKVEEQKKKKDPSIKAASLIAKAKILAAHMKSMETKPDIIDVLDQDLEDDMVTDEEVHDIIEEYNEEEEAI